MRRVIDLILLNFLWIIFSIPVITIGASTCAAYYVTLKLVDGKENPEGFALVDVIKLFLKGFKQNFKQGTILWAFTAPCIYASYLLWKLVITADDLNIFFIIGAAVYTLIEAVFIVFSYPIIARYYIKLKTAVKNSFGTALLYLKSTVLIFIIVALETAFFFWNKYTMFSAIVIGPELIIFTVSYVLKKVFVNIEKSNAKKETAETENTED
ncbi:MAG: YesL family protein [Treponema sp.]|nr:YesL family protein [Treponema sp.]